MLCYFALGSLPWEHVDAPTEEERNELLKQKKLSLSGRDICGDALPEEFATYIDYTRSLGFEVKPNYSYLRPALPTPVQVRGIQVRQCIRLDREEVS